MVCARDLTKRFGQVEACVSVSLDVRPTGVTGIIGPNGAGKTTLLRLFAGIISPSEGTVTIGGHDTVQEPLAARRLVGCVLDPISLYGDQTVEEYLGFVAGLRGVPKTDSHAEIDSSIGSFSLEMSRRKLCATLSRGFRQRVALAAALIGDPPVLILDEPATGLDPLQQSEFHETIRRLGGTKCVILSTHAMSDAETVCDDAILLDSGRVLVQSGVQEILRDTASPTLADAFRRLVAPEAKGLSQ